MIGFKMNIFNNSRLHFPLRVHVRFFTKCPNDPCLSYQGFIVNTGTRRSPIHHNVGCTGWPKKVSHYQMIKKIVLNRIKACQWD